MAELIVYFSRAGENYVNGVIQDLAVGNTEIVAKMIAELTGANMFKVEPLVAYAHDYSQCIEEAKQDQKRDARPELKAYPESMDAYGTIYLGYPNYWGTMPMALFTFLEKYDFSGKTIKPFCTHEGSAMGSSEKDIKALCPGAKVVKGLAIAGCKVPNAKETVIQWL